MSWLELAVDVDAEAVESVGELLAQYGYNGGVVIDQPIIPGDDGPEYTYDTSRPVTLRTYLPLDERAAGLRERIEHALWHFGQIRPVSPLRVRQLEEQDWAEAWKEHYTIQRIGERTVIVPSWLEYAPQPGDIVLRLDPGMAFGTGLHPTTQLCVALLEQHVQSGAVVLDLGCGSGILAIAAARLGAGAVLALDNDPIAVNATRENVARNEVDAIVHVAEGSLGGGVALGHWLYPTTPSTSLRAGDDRFDFAAPEPACPERRRRVEGQGRRQPTTDEVEDGGWRMEDGSLDASEKRSSIFDPPSSSMVGGRWSVVGGRLACDLIVANIIARVLAALAHDLAEALAPGGILISSGIIAEREAEVAVAYAAAGLAQIERRQEGDWVALVHQKE